MTAINSKKHAEKDGLASAADASFVVARQHPKPAPFVIVTVKSHAMAKKCGICQNENDSRIKSRRRIERIASGRPADQRRERARNRADQSIERGDAFQWVVREDCKLQP